MNTNPMITDRVISANFHLHSYLPLEDLPKVLKRFLTHFPPADEDTARIYEHQRLSAETHALLERLPDVDNPLPTTWLDIALQKRSPVDVHYHLLVDPLLLRPKTPVLEDKNESGLRGWTHMKFVGRGGFSTARAGELEVAHSGFATLAIEGHWHYRIPRDVAQSKEEGTPENVEIIEQVRHDIMAFLDVLSPYYAFLSHEDDYELWHPGPITHFPPPAPWRYLWSLMSYGSELSAEIGRSKLLSTPAVRLEEHGNRIDIQPLTWLTHLYENERQYMHERPKITNKERARLTCDHLGLQLPYDGYTGGF